MRAILTIIFSFSLLTLWGQSDKELCESGIKTAQKRLANRQIYFPRYIVHSSVTLRKILEIDYGIIDDFYDQYDFGFQQEYNCHDSLMLKAISNKWGADFLD